MARDETTKGGGPVKKSTSPGQFIQEVRQEMAKVTWPSRRETTVSTIMVFIMIVILAVFFLGVDAILRFGIGLLLGLGA